MEYVLGTKTNDKLDFDTNVYTESDFVLDVTTDGLKVEGVELSDDHKATLVRDSRQ